MQFKTLKYSQLDNYGLLSLDVPEQMNAMSPQMIDDLYLFFNQEPSKNIRFVILNGNGRCFGAGGDLKSMFSMNINDSENISKQAHKAFNLIGKYPIPVVAVVHEFAIGGGFELALACDMIFATTNSWFSLPELKYDILPGGGGTVRLPLAIGKREAFWNILTGNRISAEMAKQMGIVQFLVNDENYIDESVSILEKTILPIEKEAIKALKEIFSLTTTNIDKAFDKEAQRFSYLLDTFAKHKIKKFINKNKDG